MTSTEINIPLVIPPSSTPRGEGIHQSSIIRAMAAELGHLKKEWITEEVFDLQDSISVPDETSILRICIGLAWEEWYIPQLANIGVLDHPGEICVDDIYMNPDGESLDIILSQENTETHQLLVHECKATYKSARNYTPDEQWMHMRQIMGYCKGKGTRFGMLHVLFLCGDYTYPIRPTRKVWLLEFEDKELNISWTQVKEYKDRWLKERGK